MTITETFCHWVEQLNTSRPEQARRLLKTGWAAQRLRFSAAPDRRLLPADRYLACLMMDAMRAPLRQPLQSALVSVFTPCQLLHEVGLHPYNAESMSCYLSASRRTRAASSGRRPTASPRRCAVITRPALARRKAACSPPPAAWCIPT